MGLNIQPKITRTWDLTPEQAQQIIAEALHVKLDNVNIAFDFRNMEYDDRFDPRYEFSGIKVTEK